MIYNDKFLIHNIDDLIETKTSHGVGAKKVLLNKDNTISNITQIAYSRLNKDEIVHAHKHDTMEECFFLIEGKIEFKSENNFLVLKKGSFIKINSGALHELKVLQDSILLTIGVELE